MEVRRSSDRLISMIGFPIPVGQHLYFKIANWMLFICRDKIHTELKACLCNYIDAKQWYVITRSIPNSNGFFFKLPLKLKHGWMFTYYNGCNIYCPCPNLSWSRLIKLGSCASIKELQSDICFVWNLVHRASLDSFQNYWTLLYGTKAGLCNMLMN